MEESYGTVEGRRTNRMATKLGQSITSGLVWCDVSGKVCGNIGGDAWDEMSKQNV